MVPVRRRPVPLNHAEEEERQGTISSARFNIWSTMVGGGSLSLPLAFAKTGNLLVGPVLLISTAWLTQFCFGVLLDAARLVSPSSSDSLDPTTTRISHDPAHDAIDETTRSTSEEIQEPDRVSSSTKVGKDSLESITAAAFGERAHWASTVLVTLMCWFGIIGYCVLLRDMLVPVTQWLHPLPGFTRNDSADTGSTVTMANNVIMLVVVLLVTPLCTLRTLTALQRFGAASMLSVFILGMCIVYRSVECTLGVIHHHHPNTTISYLGSVDVDDQRSPVLDGSFHFMDGFTFFPKSWKDVLDVLPLFISCYVCHYNLPVVHNDLTDPTPARVRRWISSTVWGATLFYLVMGVAGSAFAMACGGSEDGTAVVVHGNILLNFDANDPLLLVGRLCLAVTIALAFPVLTIPARDIFLRAIDSVVSQDQSQWTVAANTLEDELLEPLLPASDSDAVSSEHPAMVPGLSRNNEDADEVTHADLGFPEEQQQYEAQSPLMARLWTSVVILWSGAIFASCVSSIDVVWDLLGSSLSILLSFLVPCGSYIALRRRNPPDVPPQNTDSGFIVRQPELPSISTFCWMIVLFFVPLMFLSTANAIYNLSKRS
jgi:amino acid permease